MAMVDACYMMEVCVMQKVVSVAFGTVSNQRKKETKGQHTCNA